MEDCHSPEGNDESWDHVGTAKVWWFLRWRVCKGGLKPCVWVPQGEQKAQGPPSTRGSLGSQEKSRERLETLVHGALANSSWGFSLERVLQ